MTHRVPTVHDSGATLRTLREHRGLSQKRLAARSTVARETINKIERGHVKMVRFSVVLALAYGLRVNPIELADYCDEWPESAPSLSVVTG